MFLSFSSTGTNPYLTFHCVNQGTILLDLAPEDKEYQSVEEEVTDIRMFFFAQILLRLFSRGMNSSYCLMGSHGLLLGLSQQQAFKRDCRLKRYTFHSHHKPVCPVAQSFCSRNFVSFVI